MAVGFFPRARVHIRRQCFQCRLNLLPDWLRDLTLEHGVLIGGDTVGCLAETRLHLLKNFRLVHLQQRREGAGKKLRRVGEKFLTGEKGGVDPDGFDGNGSGERIAVRVENVAALGGLPDFALRPALGFREQLAVMEHLQVHQAPA